ncbi:hypothetical protein LXA43DRAFT_1002605 [Ganoderma leucocontextum]|nr:hypothetical protein LXA43DRAFT_1002605 [Ganoderma leucocontextum]
MSATVLAEDIIYYITLHLTATSSRSARQALARLARAHSSFTKPALAVLWRSLPNAKALEHLLRVVGVAQRHPQNGQQDTPPLELCGTLATHESAWKRFQEYASLVRKITLDPFVPTPRDLNFLFNFPSDVVEDTFWRQLSSVYGATVTSILPRLEVVTLRSRDSVRFSAFDMSMLCFLTPSVREFNVDVSGVSPEGRGKFLQSFTVCFSSVQDLERISLRLETLVPVLDVGSLPRLHPRLRRLELRPTIEPNELALLASLHNLEYLSVNLSHWESPTLPVKFTGLRSLAMSSYQSNAISAFIADVDAPQLRSFTIDETHKDPKEMCRELSNCLRTLVAKWPSLTAFHWNSTQSWGGDGGGASPLTELIGPLLSLRTIRNFSASFHRVMATCSPTDFRAIAEAWPDIETIDLPIIDDNVDQYADVESLVSFAHHCPRLHSLLIPKVKFDPNASAAVVCRTAPHWLRRLDVASLVFSGEQDAASQGV